MLQDGGLPTGARAGEVLAHVAALHARPARPPRRSRARLGPRPRAADHGAAALRWPAPAPGARGLAVVGPTRGRVPRRADRGPRPAGAGSPSGAWCGRCARPASRSCSPPTSWTRPNGWPTTSSSWTTAASWPQGTPAELTARRRRPAVRRTAGPRPRDAARRRCPKGCTAAEPAPGRYVVEGRESALGPGAIATVTAWCAAHGVHAGGPGAGPPHPGGRLPRPHRPGAAMTFTAERPREPGRRRRPRRRGAAVGVARRPASTRASCCATASRCS